MLPIYLGFYEWQKSGFCGVSTCEYSHLPPLQDSLTGCRGASATTLAPVTPADTLTGPRPCTWSRDVPGATWRRTRTRLERPHLGLPCAPHEPAARRTNLPHAVRACRVQPRGPVGCGHPQRPRLRGTSARRDVAPGAAGPLPRSRRLVAVRTGCARSRCGTKGIRKHWNNAPFRAGADVRRFRILPGDMP